MMGWPGSWTDAAQWAVQFNYIYVVCYATHLPVAPVTTVKCTSIGWTERSGIMNVVLNHRHTRGIKKFFLLRLINLMEVSLDNNGLLIVLILVVTVVLYSTRHLHCNFPSYFCVLTFVISVPFVHFKCLFLKSDLCALVPRFVQSDGVCDKCLS